MDKKKTAVEVYLSTVFKWGLIILVCACMCATVMFNTEKMFGLYPTVPWLATIGLGIMDSIFFAGAMLIIKAENRKDFLSDSIGYSVELSLVYAANQDILGILVFFPYSDSILFGH